jgi:uncharacterized membrane protein HdeD (DUF308 family)
MLRMICGRWWVLLLRGIVAILVGVAMIAQPAISLLALAYLFAIFTAIDGIVAVVIGIRGESDGTVWWTMIILGALAIAAGIIAAAMALTWPGLTLLVLLSVVAASAIVRGVFEIAAAIRLRKEIDDEWLLGLSGFLSILFGALILSRPGAGIVVIAILIGAYLLALGVMAIALSLRLRRLGNKLEAAAV